MSDSVLPEITVVDGTWQVSGDIRVENAQVVFSKSATLEMGSQINVDFSHVTDVDTTVLSLMMEWQRRAIHAKAKITFSSVPDNLISLATLYGVADFLPLHAR